MTFFRLATACLALALITQSAEAAPSVAERAAIERAYAAKLAAADAADVASRIAARWGLTRDELDDYGYTSHVRAAAATREGRFAREIAPVGLPAGTVEVDEGIRFEPDRAKLSTLKPAFKADGMITAGNSSQISDGAAAVLLASGAALERHHSSELFAVENGE